MKKIGVIGGLGPESTVDYYKGIIKVFRERTDGEDYPEIILYSANMTDLIALVKAKEWDTLVDWLVARAKALHQAGAEFAVIGSNTPHIVFDSVKSRAPFPMLSIVEETCQKAEGLGLKKLGLMGTKFTMESDFYQKVFHTRGMSIVVPEKEAQQLIHEKLFSEIELGIIKDSTRESLLSIVKDMIDKHSIDSVILGCTELPLILDKDEYGIPFLNTTAIHIESIVNYCIGEYQKS
jgi:aspartate racemase